MGKKRTSKIWLISKEEFKEIFESSNTISDMTRKIGFSISATHHKTIKQRIIEDNLPLKDIQERSRISHAEQAKRAGIKKQIPLENILIQNSSYARGELKKRLIKNGMIENKCSICGMDPIWNGKNIVSLNLQPIHSKF